MGRSDRLFDLIQILRDGALHTAEELAQATGVSVRTIYRDMETLRASGLPVEGERGVGYAVTAPVTLPPLNLNLAELEALHLGLAIIGEAADKDLQAAARSLSSKIDAVLPEDTHAPRTGWGLAVYPFAEAAQGLAHMPPLRAAIRARQKVELAYQGLDGPETTRVVRPLELEYWGRVWTLTGWCELCADFRVFRMDRIASVTALPSLFVDEPGKRLADYDPRAAKRAGT